MPVRKLIEGDDYLGAFARCAKCNSEVSTYLSSARLIAVRPQAEYADWWAACDNVDCPNHEGEAIGQCGASFAVPAHQLVVLQMRSPDVPPPQGVTVLVGIDIGILEAEFKLVEHGSLLEELWTTNQIDAGRWNVRIAKPKWWAHIPDKMK